MPQSEHHHHPRAKLKVWIRGLPPAMTEEEFKELLESITPPNNKSIDWQRLVPANKRVPTTTAYLHFSNEEALFGLFSKLDGHKFIDAKGREYRALIEYAPYQKIPRKKVIDKREGTIEKDADFIAFQEKLESELNMKVESAEAWLERREQEAQAAKALLSAEGENGVVVHEVVHTPLLDYLREKKERDQRDRSKKRDEERRRKADEERQRRMGRSSDRKRRGHQGQGPAPGVRQGGQEPSDLVQGQPVAAGKSRSGQTPRQSHPSEGQGEAAAPNSARPVKVPGEGGKPKGGQEGGPPRGRGRGKSANAQGNPGNQAEGGGRGRGGHAARGAGGRPQGVYRPRSMRGEKGEGGHAGQG